MVDMNLSMRQNQNYKHREQTGGSLWEGDQGMDELGVWDQQMKALTYRMQSVCVYIYIYIYIYKTESLCCTAEINTIL